MQRGALVIAPRIDVHRMLRRHPLPFDPFQRRLDCRGDAFSNFGEIAVENLSPDVLAGGSVDQLARGEQLHQTENPQGREDCGPRENRWKAQAEVISLGGVCYLVGGS